MASDTEKPDTGVASNDAYTGMLVISLLALIVGSVLLFLDYSQHSGKPPTASIPGKVEPQQPKKDDGKQPEKAPEPPPAN